MDQWFTSIGLDIGTSTTKFIVSRLLLQDANDPFHPPGCGIVERKITYSSPMHPTPLKGEQEIDMMALARLLAHEYEQSGARLDDVKAGAVIITGETARKANAERIIHHLAERAGDFVIATAGADLEGILAGKGSGAMRRSEDTQGVVANIDIGGGTANVALFQHGKVMQTFTFHLGGRLIRLDELGQLHYVSEHLRPWFTVNGLPVRRGRVVGYDELSGIVERMSHGMLSHLAGSPRFHPDLLLLGPNPAPLPVIDEVIFSGGVGHMMDQNPPPDLREAAKYGDIGPLLASTLRRVARQYPMRVGTAVETARATVIGAGMQNIEVSGATVYVNRHHVPLKNVPILRVSVTEDDAWSENDFHLRLNTALMHATRLYDAGSGTPFALALERIPYCTYALLQRLAESICQTFAAHFPQSSQLVVICEMDIAKALGQSLAKRCGEDIHVICLDQIDFTHGDYVDIGLPVAGEAVPIAIKTLAFA